MKEKTHLIDPERRDFHSNCPIISRLEDLLKTLRQRERRASESGHIFTSQ